MANSWKYKTGYNPEDLNTQLYKEAITEQQKAAYDKQVQAYSNLGGMPDSTAYTNLTNYKDVPGSFKAMAGGGVKAVAQSTYSVKGVDYLTGGQYAKEGDQILEDSYAEERKNIWGASDDTQGRSFLEKIAGLTPEELASSTHTQEQMIDKLYTAGLGRETDIQGAVYHLGELQSGKSIQEVAQNFLLSEEAGIKDVYSDVLQRDVDQEGLEYHLSQTQMDDLSDNALRAALGSAEFERQQIKAANTGIGGLGTLADDKQQFDSLQVTPLQQSIKDLTETGFYTHQRKDLSSEIKANEMKKVNPELYKQTLQDFTKGQMTIGNLLNQYAAANPASEGGISQLPTSEDIETLTPPNTGDNPWALYDTDFQDPYDWSDLEPAGTGSEGTGPETDPPAGPPATGDPDPDPDPPETEDFDASPPESPIYKDAKTEFDNTLGGIDTSPQFDMSIRSSAYSKAGASAKGVRLKRSKKFKSGESALGTKQLGRQLQIQSLNI